MTTLYSPPPGIEPNFNRPEPHHPRLIGLSGYAQSGKDTVAGIVGSLYGHERRAFADKVREYVYNVNPIVSRMRDGEKFHDSLQFLVHLLGWDEAKKIPEVRRLLQAAGTNAREMFGDLVWIQATFKDMLYSKPYVISDVRFQNEAKWIKAQGGVVLRIERVGVEAINDHISEHDLDDWDFDGRIQNDDSLLDLQAEVMLTLGDLG